VDTSVSRDRKAGFEPKIVPPGETRFTGFDDKIRSLYARGLRRREIQSHREESYGGKGAPG
jgi:putative transposase